MTDRQRGPLTTSSPVSQAPSRAWRLICLLAVFAVQLLYVPLNRTLDNGMVLDIPLDAFIPLWPIWAVPYLLAVVWWAAAFIWAAWKMDDRRYGALIIAALATMLAAYVAYIFFPTYVERPVPVGHSWADELVRQIYANDDLYNAFPSGHAYNTVLITFFWWDWQPRLRWLWVTITIIVLLSTLFTGQHNLLDPLGGIVWAWLGYRLGLLSSRLCCATRRQEKC